MQQRIKNMIQVREKTKNLLFKVSAMAHDLKTPLTVIRNSELLQLAPLSGVDVQCLKDIESR